MFALKNWVRQRLGVDPGRGVQGTRRRRPVPLGMERLEDRLAPAGGYTLSLIAAAGTTVNQYGPLTGFGPNVSINDVGTVAFVGNREAGPGIFVAPQPGSVSELTTTAQFGRDYGQSVQINNSDQVVGRLRETTGGGAPIFQLRVWDAEVGTIGFGLYEIIGGSNRGDFESVSTHASISNEGTVTYSTVIPSDLGGSSLAAVDRTTVQSPSLEHDVLGATYQAPKSYRPMVADGGIVVVRQGANNNATDPILLYSSGPPTTIAGGEFAAKGRSSGISDDGRIVVFYGDLTPIGAATLSGTALSLGLKQLDPGPGIFVSLEMAGKRVVQRVAGLAGNGFLDPGEIHLDANGDGVVDVGEDAGLFTAFTADMRVGVNATWDGSTPGMFTVAYQARSLTDAEGVYTTEVKVDPTQLILKADVAARVVEVGDSLPGSAGVVTELSLYDPINNRGQVVFWANTVGGGAVIRAEPIRRPVLLVPGIMGSYAADLTNDLAWLMNRGPHPSQIQIDPLGGFYNATIQTFENAGYVRDKDLFVAVYDWRLPNGPTDLNLDGQISGLTAAEISDTQFRYTVDYLGYWLKEAAMRWAQDHPTLPPLDYVDIVAHSMGGLASRSYIQSDAYGGQYAPGMRLPKVSQFITVGTPHQGAAKAWNPLNDDWDSDPSYRYLLSKLLNRAYKEVLAGQTITGPTQINLASITPFGSNEPDPVRFINQYVPSLRDLLATYDIGIPETFAFGTRNEFVFDLNAGYGLPNGPSGDPNFFASLVGQTTVIYSGSIPTITTVRERIGPLDPPADPFTLQPFSGGHKHMPHDTRVWYEEFETPVGDGTVPLESAYAQFAGEVRVHTRAISGADHTGLMSNLEAQKVILHRLGLSLPDHQIKTGSSIGGGVVGVGVAGLWSLFNDPVDVVLTDVQGRRFGYTAATGPLMEIPASVWVGGADGSGWIFGPIEGPATVTLIGRGEDHLVQIVGEQADMVGSLESSGFLAAGETRTFPASAWLTPLPQAVADTWTFAFDVPVTENVLTNDISPRGVPLTAAVTMDVPSDHGTLLLDPNGQFTFTPIDGFVGSTSFQYRVEDGTAQSHPATATIRIESPPANPLVTAVTLLDQPAPELMRLALDFSVPMSAASVEAIGNYAVARSGSNGLTIQSATYSQENDQPRVVLTVHGPEALPSGEYVVRLNGRQVRSAEGVPFHTAGDHAVVIVNDQNAVATVGAFPGTDQLGLLNSSSFGYGTPASFLMRDLTGDGILDLVTAHDQLHVEGAAGRMLFFRGTGDGDFAAPAAYALDPDFSAVRINAADWDGDGLLDVLVGGRKATYWERAEQVYVFLSDGAGTFVHAPETPFPVTHTGNFDAPVTHTMVVADILPSPGPEIVAYKQGYHNMYGGVPDVPGELQIVGEDPFLGYGQIMVVPLGVPMSMGGYTFADVNEDGRDDILACGTSVVVIPTFGTAEFGAARDIAFQHAPNFGVGVLGVGDVDGDSHLDIVVVHEEYSNWAGVHDGSVITVLKGDGTGQFVQVSRTLMQRRGSGLLDLKDMDGDGNLDLFVKEGDNYGQPDWIDADGAAVSVWRGDGHGSFAQPTGGADLITAEHAFAGWQVVDVDGDGDLDACFLANRLSMVLNDGQGRFTALFGDPPFFGPVGAGGEVFLGDLNRDGLPDMAVNSGRGLEILLGEPNGQFRPTDFVDDTGGGNPRGGDLNGDGNIDLVVNNSGLTVLLGRGNGTFYRSAYYTSNPGYRYYTDFQLVDVNRDGNLDALVVAWDHPGVLSYAVYFGDGSGQLFFNSSSLTSHTMDSLILGDFDGDGRVDILRTNDYHFQLLRGNGNGTFLAGEIQPEWPIFPLFRTADIDGDGDLDVLGLTENTQCDRTVYSYLNDGTGWFTEKASVQVRGCAVTLDPGDFDADGNIDVGIVGSSLGSTYTRSFAYLKGDGLGDFGPPVGIDVGGVSSQSFATLTADVFVTAGAVHAVQPSMIHFESAALSVEESAGEVTVRVTRAGDLGLDAAVQFAITGGTATVDADYIPTAGTLTFQPGQAASSFVVKLLDDNLIDGAKTILLALADVTGAGASLGHPDVMTMTIKDDEMPWKNSLNPLDVNRDSDVSPLDALIVINDLNSKGSRPLLPPDDVHFPPPFVDVSGDNFISPLDALQVINYLNTGNGEGENDMATIGAAQATTRWETGIRTTRAPKATFADTARRMDASQAGDAARTPSGLYSRDLLFAKLEDGSRTSEGETTDLRKDRPAGDLEEFLSRLLRGEADEEELR